MADWSFKGVKFGIIPSELMMEELRADFSRKHIKLGKTNKQLGIEGHEAAKSHAKHPEIELRDCCLAEGVE